MHLISHFLIVFLVIGNVACLCECSNNSSYGCIEAERNALIKFKQSFFNDTSSMLSSWKGVSCCRWKGIGCDSNTGNVIKISLPMDYNYDYYSPMEANKLDSSLLQLRYLNYLDLSRNNFHATPIPEFLGALKGIKYLDISYANFTIGTFPRQLENFTNLQVLNLSGIDLSGVRNLLSMLNKLPSLKVLSLSGCQLDPAQLQPAYSNVTFFPSLRELYLKGNNGISSPFPYFLKNMKSLEVLDLGNNSFSNEVPTWLTDLKELEYLDLSINHFSKVEGGLLRILSGLCHLKTFDFSFNKYHQGSLESNKNMSRGCITYDLEALAMRSAGLTGTIPDELCQFKKLKSLVLSDNALHGPIPASIGNLSALVVLDLSNNQLDNAVPDSIGQLVNLGSFDLFHNNLKGNITETHFLNVSNLKYLDLSSNQLTINVAPDWIPPFQLREMDMSSCKIGGTVFPRWLRSQNQMGRLVLSNTSIRGPWPKWFQSSALTELDLTHNEISGHIPHNVAALLPALQ